MEICIETVLTFGLSMFSERTYNWRKKIGNKKFSIHLPSNTEFLVELTNGTNYFLSTKRRHEWLDLFLGCIYFWVQTYIWAFTVCFCAQSAAAEGGELQPGDELIAIESQTVVSHRLCN